MFPLLPALILLILHGQAPQDLRRVLGTHETLPWQVVARQIEADGKSPRPHLARMCALLRLLAPRVDPAPDAERIAEASPQLVGMHRIDRLAEGFDRARRSRDGPSVQS